ncbi:MAG: TetR/AcrR family transcriptional regulator [Actinobacteria bacterium]|nr:TetR/AcrR family transcriptional regulator [Actinomycetota bacterium]
MSTHSVEQPAKRTSDMRRARRLPPDQRREQIIAAVIRVVAEYGVPEATVSRIAEAAGVSEGTLYVYFDNRTDMLLTALDSIRSEMHELIDDSVGSDALDRMRNIGKAHTEMTRTNHAGFTYPWFEFIAAGPQVGLRESVAQTHKSASRRLKKIIEEGQANGEIRADIDPDELTWGFYTVVWAENMACLMGLTDYVERGHAARVLDLILKDALPYS